MKGKILAYDEKTEAGVISGENDKRYEFTTSGFMGNTTPNAGDEVDFEVDGSSAMGIYPVATQQRKLNFGSDDAGGQKNSVFICYGLLGIGLFTGIFWILGGIWAFIKKGEATEPLEQTHYANLVSVFLWGTVLSIVGLFTLVFIVGWVILILTWVWAAYRILKGVSKLSSNQAFE
ncbi:MAG: hypothetical protein JKY53_12980 [Flavobacteriales bacterium]|nr:hypothetical protein [Flavobacteriales bacterium]